VVDAWDGLVDGAQRLWDDPGQWASDTWNGLVDGVTGTWDQVTEDPLGWVTDALFSEETQENWSNGNYLEAVGQGVAENAVALIPYFGWGKKLDRLGDIADGDNGDRGSDNDDEDGDDQQQADDQDQEDQDSPSCTRPSSFVPGTPVLLADGTTLPIEDVAVGDEVLAFDPLTGEEGPREATDLITGSGAKTLVTLTVDDGQGGADTITATDAHPFWVPEQAAWVEAADLEPGTWLRTSAGTWTQATAVDTERVAEQRVHNLTVADLHTYYVSAGDTSLLVHNTPPECGDLGDSWEPRDPSEIPGDRGGCEACALEIIDRLGGGEVLRIAPPPYARQLWKYRDQEVQWNVHYAVIKDGRVYDAWTDRTGEPLETYMSQWEDAGETTVTTRGSLAPNPDSGGYTFTPGE
jgi:hypothetical protein